MLWHKVIRSKYRMAVDGWWPNEGQTTTYRSPWKVIQHLLPVFLNHASLKVGNIDRIRFWEDTWGERQPFKVKYPNLFRLSLLHNKSISDFLVNSTTSESSWNLHFRRHVSEWEFGELANLLSSWRG